MPNLAWIAQILFYFAYFMTYITDGATTHPVWYAVSAWSALVCAIALAFFNGYPYLQTRRPVE